MCGLVLDEWIESSILCNMRSFCFIIILLSFSNILYSQSTEDYLFNRLDSLTAIRDTFVKDRLIQIDKYKTQLKSSKNTDQFILLEHIYDEYKSFIYDSAFAYAVKLQDIAYHLGDPEKIVTSKMKLGFVLISSGLLNEGLDTLKTVRLKGLPKSLKLQYYYLMVRTCFDLADFAQNHFYGLRYADMAGAYVDSATALTPPDNADYLNAKGLKALHLRKMPEAKSYFEDLIQHQKLSDHQFAIVTSTLSYIYGYSGDSKRSKEMLIKAAIADTKSCTKEAIALVKLADLLYYKEGNVEEAYKYIKLAMDDANFYGARYRKMQAAAIFPVIEGERLAREEARRKMLLLYSLIITISIVTIIGISYTIYKQNSKLKKAERIIMHANHQLHESNRIKEEYLWYYFNSTADYIAKLEALKATIELKVISKKVEELRFTAENINIKRERNDLFHNFDKVFLKLFPDYTNVFNSLLTEGNKIVLKEGHLLNIEMRIFALIRLGIQDHEKIAKILGYSLTTIYTYKTRIKAKASVSSEEFDNKILSLSTI
jgi:hypothetical protein